MRPAFAHPWMVAAFVAVLLPIIIEWLFRRRRRRVELPTIRFLLRNKEQKKVKRQDRILLMIRMLGVFFLVLAIARPLIRRGLGGSSRRHVVVVLDGTGSMNQQVGVTTAFSLAQKKASAMVRGVPAGAVVSVVMLGDKAETIVERETDAQTAAARIDSLRCGSGAAPMAIALESTKDLLARGKDEQPEICIFSDFQKHTWATDNNASKGVSQTLNGLSSQSETFLIGEVSDEARQLTQVTFDCLYLGIKAIKPFGKVIDIGRAIQQYAHAHHYSVVREYQGHGIGQVFHQEPGIPHYVLRSAAAQTVLPGMAFTIEPMINAGTWKTVLDQSDGWTVRTGDGRLSAQFEHTILMTEDGPEILTLTENGPQAGYRF